MLIARRLKCYGTKKYKKIHRFCHYILYKEKYNIISNVNNYYYNS